MNLNEFLYNLHYDIAQVKPPDWEVDWEDAPLSYKLYCNLPVTPLSAEIPLTDFQAGRSLEHIGHFLWYAYGITQVSQSFYMDSPDLIQYRRFAPSGGGLYPSEVYLYLKVEGLVDGVYHYDAAHHRLVQLRQGNFDRYLSQTMGERCEMGDCFGAVFVSTMFWKNFFKYNHFAYRLQGLDAGALIGQIREAGKRFGIESQVHFQFLDRAVNHFLGLNEQEESVYAIIPISTEPVLKRFSDKTSITADSLCGDLPELETEHYERSNRVLDYPMIRKMNEAALLGTTESFSDIKGYEKGREESWNIPLPPGERVFYDFTEVCMKRISPDMDFFMEKIARMQLATLLQESIQGTDSELSVYGCFYNIEGVPDGAYEYGSSTHSIRPIREGDMRFQLQSAMTAHNVNLYQVPICLHIIGDRSHLKEEHGYRGYRIQQMKAGMLVQRLLLTASSLGMGGHPLLGFDVKQCDDIYELEKAGKTTLIQIPIGHYRPRPWLKGSLNI